MNNLAAVLNKLHARLQRQQASVEETILHIKTIEEVRKNSDTKK